MSEIALPVENIVDIMQIVGMTFKSIVLLALACFVLAGCGEPLSPPLPPLLLGATVGGGGNYLCNPDRGKGSAPDTASYSPEIVQRLRRDFPIGTPAAKLKVSLTRQGFSLYEHCFADRSVSWAAFRQNGGNGITAMAAFGTVYWKQDQAGRLLWATGNITFSGL